MYFEKLGFMLTFWNLAGVPLSYCHCTLYLANHDPSEYAHPKWLLAILFPAYLFVYWVWDTANSQKNHFRRKERGSDYDRKTFPVLPWREVHNPKIIRTDTGKNLLAGGWYGLARKIHYTCDLYFALNWGLITGFKSPFPWFYPVFFSLMIIHRAARDIQRCRQVYGEAWKQYERQVPYLFIPVSSQWGGSKAPVGSLSKIMWADDFCEIVRHLNGGLSPIYGYLSRDAARDSGAPRALGSYLVHTKTALIHSSFAYSSRCIVGASGAIEF